MEEDQKKIVTGLNVLVHNIEKKLRGYATGELHFSLEDSYNQVGLLCMVRNLAGKLSFYPSSKLDYMQSKIDHYEKWVKIMDKEPI